MMTKKELVSLVETIIRCEKTEEEIDEMIGLLEKNVPHPAVTDLIYHENLSAAEIVERALNYKPIQL